MKRHDYSMLLKNSSIIFALLYCSAAYSWQSGKTEFYPLYCQSLIKNGAEEIYLKITAESGSYGVPYLVGKDGGTEKWSHRFPEYGVNLAKFKYTCQNDTITLTYANPGNYNYLSQTFIWNGRFVEMPIRFSKGTDNWVAYNETSAGQKDWFRFWAKKGQRIRFLLNNIYAPSKLEIFEPKSNIPIKTIEFGKEDVAWSHVLKKTGEYRMVLIGTADNSHYYVKLWIN